MSRLVRALECVVQERNGSRYGKTYGEFARKEKKISLGARIRKKNDSMEELMSLDGLAVEAPGVKVKPRNKSCCLSTPRAPMLPRVFGLPAANA